MMNIILFSYWNFCAHSPLTTVIWVQIMRIVHFARSGKYNAICFSSYFVFNLLARTMGKIQAKHQYSVQTKLNCKFRFRIIIAHYHNIFHLLKCKPTNGWFLHRRGLQNVELLFRRNSFNESKLKRNRVKRRINSNSIFKFQFSFSWELFQFESVWINMEKGTTQIESIKTTNVKQINVDIFGPCEWKCKVCF